MRIALRGGGQYSLKGGLFRILLVFQSFIKLQSKFTYFILRFLPYCQIENQVAHMIKSALVAVLFTFSALINAQAQTPVRERNSRIDLMIMANHSNMSSLPAKYSYGMMGSFRFNKLMSSFFPLSFGQDYAHLSLSTVFAPIGLLVLKTNDDFDNFREFFGTLLAIATAIERMGFHITLAPQVELIPYYSLLGLHFYGDEGYTSSSSGAMLRFYFSPNWYANGYAEYNRFYASPRQTGILTGLCIGYAFK